MRFKHSELLSTTRELVLPLQYKKLLEIQMYLDNTLHFLKECRKQSGYFPEVKKSIE
jgi:hypothetical protein